MLSNWWRLEAETFGTEREVHSPRSRKTSRIFYEKSSSFTPLSTEVISSHLRVFVFRRQALRVRGLSLLRRDMEARQCFQIIEMAGAYLESLLVKAPEASELTNALHNFHSKR